MADGSNGNGMNRRRFLKVLGVTGGGAAALTGCSTDQVEKLIPYLVPPDNQVPGIATYYASTCRECPAGCGVHVRVREGRAVKLEGNPESPVNAGRLCARGQAGLQGLYNPDRVQQPMARQSDGTFKPIAWDDAIQQIVQRLGEVSGDQVRFLTGYETGSFSQIVDEFVAALGGGTHNVHEPFGYEALARAAEMVFGIAALPVPDLTVARYILSFGADFLETWMNPVSYASAYAVNRAPEGAPYGRYVHIEPRMSMTAMNADEWIAPAPGSEALIALAMAHVIVRDGLVRLPGDASTVRSVLEPYAPESVAPRTDVSAETIERLAQEFTTVPSVALVGGMGAQHDQAHFAAAAVLLLNYVAGNIGRTLLFQRDAVGAHGRYTELTAFARSMQNGGVGVLFVHRANPVYASPAGVDVGAAMDQVGFKVSFSQYLDETSSRCDLVLPDHDPMEQWNDWIPRPGVRALQQPVMQPVFDTRQTGDVLLGIARAFGRTPGGLTASDYKTYLQNRWQDVQAELGDRGPFETFWSEALQHGGVWREPQPQRVALAPTVSALREAAIWTAPADGLTLVVYPSSTLYDGRGANRPWLQELPDPVTKVTWVSWVELHPETAASIDVLEGDFVRVETSAGALEAPAYLYPGIRRDTIAVQVGRGHTAFGRYAGRGINAYRLLPGEVTAFGGLGHYTGARITKTGAHEYLPKTEGKRHQLDRGIAQAVTVQQLTSGEAREEHGAHAAPVPQHIEDVIEEWQQAQYAEEERGNYAGDQPRWAMVIDIAKCTGCSACVTACNAENNIPHVGPEQIRLGREMSWMRIERYFEGDEDGGPLETRHVPMLCQQCGNAPCEPVCPVFAAYHTPDGLNGQVYNRCVGTRYCANNCPYKVRYFNYYDFQKQGDPYFAWEAPLQWLLNPDVTVRSKGVMEKCTFCVQRIRGAQRQAKLDGRDSVADGAVVPACQQTCPAGAIVFGDIRDPASRVREVAQSERGYHVLGDLNTRPAVTYLKKIRNVAGAPAEEHD